MFTSPVSYGTDLIPSFGPTTGIYLDGIKLMTNVRGRSFFFFSITGIGANRAEWALSETGVHNDVGGGRQNAKSVCCRPKWRDALVSARGKWKWRKASEIVRGRKEKKKKDRPRLLLSAFFSSAWNSYAPKRPSWGRVASHTSRWPSSFPALVWRTDHVPSSTSPCLLLFKSERRWRKKPSAALDSFVSRKQLASFQMCLSSSSCMSFKDTRRRRGVRDDEIVLFMH